MEHERMDRVFKICHDPMKKAVENFGMVFHAGEFRREVFELLADEPHQTSLMTARDIVMNTLHPDCR